MSRTERELQHALPFAMEPVVYDFAINDRGTTAELWEREDALMPSGYYALCVPQWLRHDVRQLSPTVQSEIARFAVASRTHPRLARSMESLFAGLFPQPTVEQLSQVTLKRLQEQNGFDPELHEQIRADLRAGRIGLAQNRLPANTVIEDVADEDVIDCTRPGTPDNDCHHLGQAALARGEVAVLTLAAGSGSRWTQGAGVVKALHPFCRFHSEYRNFLQVHLAKSRRVAKQFGAAVAHIISTSYLTHQPIERSLEKHARYGYLGPLCLSPGRSVGLRMIPMPRDLRFAWEEMPQQILDGQAQKVRESLHASLIAWADRCGGGNDYTDNLPLQCLYPIGHWFEMPNLLRNGVLTRLVAQRPQLQYLMLHNLDTLGADLDPGMVGLHIRENACLSFEVIPRRIEDTGGGLARVNGRVRLVESLAMPREEYEFHLSYYNSMTTWITLDRLLEVFGLTRDDLADEQKVTAAVRHRSLRLPTYIALKDVKKRWGHGQEDVFPVAQFEKLWGDMTSLAEVACRFFVVPRLRGQQLKDPAQLDIWLRDGSAAYVDSLCDWAE